MSKQFKSHICMVNERYHLIRLELLKQKASLVHFRRLATIRKELLAKSVLLCGDDLDKLNFDHVIFTKAHDARCHNS